MTKTCVDQRVAGLLSGFGALLMLSTTPSALAAVSVVGVGAFPVGSALVTFGASPVGTELNGLSTGGINFNYLVGGIPTNGQISITSGPGATNNLPAQTAVSVGNPTGTIVMTLSGTVNQFGYGFAVLNGMSVSNATTMTIFSGSTNLGSLAYNAVPDPMFAGGFAGLLSTIAFNRVEVTFSGGPAFAFGNVRYANVGAAAVPEPATWGMLIVGFGLTGTAIRRKRRATLAST